MKVHLSVSREEEVPFDDDFFLRIASETFKHCKSLLAGKDAITIDVVTVSQAKIQELNKTYRGKDAVTDILSFGEYADTEALTLEKQEAIFLGEIFFYYGSIQEAATEDGVTVAHELIYVFSHGVLHLLGYDHGDEMFAIQDAVTESLMKNSTTKVSILKHKNL